MIWRFWVQCLVGAIFYFALLHQYWQDPATIWQKMMNYRKTQVFYFKKSKGVFSVSFRTFLKVMNTVFNKILGTLNADEKKGVFKLEIHIISLL